MRAALVLVFVASACNDGGGVHHLPDAPPPPDGTPDAAPQPVSIKVSNSGAPRAGVKVFFQGADSTLISMKLTDAAGDASELVPAGGFVTALDPFFNVGLRGGALPHALRTFAGVKPGDHLLLDLPAPSNTTANITFIVPPDGDRTVTGYRIYTACGENDFTGGAGSSSAVVLTLTGCGTVSDIAVESRDATSSAVHALYHPNASIAMDGTIDLTADSYQATTVATFDYTNVRADIPTLVLDAFLYTAHGRLVHGALNPSVSGGTASAVLPRASIAGSTAVTVTEMYPGGFGRHQVVDWGTPGPYNLDANLLLPEYQGTPQIDFTTRTASWTSAAGAQQPDVVVVEARFSREVPQFQVWDWRLAAPYTGTAVTFPKLVGDAAGFDLQPTDVGGVNRLGSAKVPGGYDAIRPGALSFEVARDLVAGGTGRVVYVELTPPPGVHAARR